MDIVLVNRSFSEYLEMEIMFFYWEQMKARETVAVELCLQQGCELLLMKSKFRVILSSGASQATCGGNPQQNPFPWAGPTSLCKPHELLGFLLPGREFPQSFHLMWRAVLFWAFQPNCVWCPHDVGWVCRSWSCQFSKLKRTTLFYCSLSRTHCLYCSTEWK